MSDTTPNPETHIALFQRKEVRRTIHNNEWWFVIADVVAVLTDAVDPGDYLKKMRKRDSSFAEAFQGGGQLAPPLGLEFDTAGGRQMLQCWNTEGLFRLIQSIPSPKAFRRHRRRQRPSRTRTEEWPEGRHQRELPRPQTIHKEGASPEMSISVRVTKYTPA